ncbi:C1 family peptidase [Rhizobium mongolense]|uniref:C1 family peptidase n=1 Tax=Rhizobium TaxID=379 RepID=UPI0024B1BD39|nr:C1 family peptidase [Rhizobium sp. CC1099]WFU90224.1 C1 family peptidase [Rhizobium sp. CC1099]
MAAVQHLTEIRNVPKDAIDLRDQPYLPTLRPLLPRLSPSRKVMRALKQDKPLEWLPRNQGTEGTCAAHAAAALIDIQRMLDSQTPLDIKPVSARMLYEMATLQAEQPRGISLRDVIKGFYHNGVCADALWPYQPGISCGGLNVRRSKDARRVSLGAYYRLRASLNDYHAALNEVGPILVSAATHSGWDPEPVRQNKGRIIPSATPAGGHAFVVVGYDSSGFIVLNSWGRGWGGYLGCNGLGHWTYEDWADNIYDGWVLRLGVSTPSAFTFTVGEQGIFFNRNTPASRSVPAYEVQGHLIHLDDGDPVSRSRYPYDNGSIEETCRYLRRDKGDPQPVARKWKGTRAAGSVEGYRGVLLKLGGSLLGLNEMASQVSCEKRLIKDHGLYPLTIAWCNDFVEQTTIVLSTLFEEATKQTKTRGDELDRLIEEHTHGIGRAFWRDVELASRKAAAPTGPIHKLATELVNLPSYTLHIICDGAGVMVMRDLLETLKTRDTALYSRLIERVTSVDFITPLIEAEDFEAAFSDLLDRQRTGAAVDATLHMPSKDTDMRLSVGMYSKSIVDLIERAFCARPGATTHPNFIGKSLMKSRFCDRLQQHDAIAALSISEITIDAAPGELLRQEDLYNRSRMLRAILERVAPIGGCSHQGGNNDIQ